MRKGFSSRALLAVVLLGFGGAPTVMARPPELGPVAKAFVFANDCATALGDEYRGVPTFVLGGPKQSPGVLVLDPSVFDVTWVRHEDLELGLRQLFEDDFLTARAIHRFARKQGGGGYKTGYWSGRKEGSKIEVVLLKETAGKIDHVDRSETKGSKNVGLITFAINAEQSTFADLGGFATGEEGGEGFQIFRFARSSVLALVNP